MRRIAFVALLDLRLTLRDRSSLFWIFIAPVLWVYFFGSIAGGSDPSQVRIGLRVHLEETTPPAERLVAYLAAENLAVEVVRPGDEEPEGTPARRLRVARGFAASIAAREKVHLELREERDVQSEATFALEVALHRALVRLLADEALGGMDPADDAVRVDSTWAAIGRRPTGLRQSIPGNLVMFVLIATMTYGAALLAAQRKDGTLRRLAVSPLTRGELIAGKALGRGAIAAVQVGVFLVLGLAVFRIHWGTSPGGLAMVLAAYVACAASLSLLAGTLFRSPDAAAGIGVVLTLVMSALGGCWWPSEVMPVWMQTAGHAFPTAWAMDGLHALISWGGDAGDVLLPTAVLSLYAAAAAFLAARRLRTLT